MLELKRSADHSRTADMLKFLTKLFHNISTPRDWHYSTNAKGEWQMSRWNGETMETREATKEEAERAQVYWSIR
jgi:hypothetical protein